MESERQYRIYLTVLINSNNGVEQLDSSEERALVMTIFVVLLVLWLLELVASYTMGGFINILLVIAIMFVLLRFILRGGNPWYAG
jgi:hypothetical protein